MRTIRLKGKHIILSIVFVVVALLAAYVATPHLFIYHAEKLNNSGRVREAQTVYDRVAGFFPYSTAASFALYQSAGYDAPSYYSLGSRFEEEGLVYIFPNFSSSRGLQTTKADVRKAAVKYLKIVERYPSSNWASHALKQLAAIYYYLEDYDNAEYYVNEYINSSKHSAAEGYLMLAELFRLQGKMQEALDAVETLQQQFPGHYTLDTFLLKSELLIDMGRLYEAEKIAKNILEIAVKEYSDLNDRPGEIARTDNVNIWKTRADRLIARIEVARNNPRYGGSISGTITKEGLPYAGVYVYVQSKTYSNTAQSPPDYVAKTKTDKDGKFSIEGLLAGNYQIGLGVPAHTLEGYTLEKKDVMSMLSVVEGRQTNIDLRFVKTLKLISPVGGEQVNAESVTFRWEPVPGAKTYSLYAGPVTIDESGAITAHSFAPVTTGITENSITLSLENFDLKRPLTISYDQNGVSPDVVLGPMYPGRPFTWGVYAYDENGSELSSSRGYGSLYSQRDLPVVSIEGHITNNGDRLLLEYKYQEAISAYKEALEKNPKDIHSLSALAKLSHYGLNKTREDYLEAAGYYRRILDIVDAPELRYSLADVLFEAKEYREALIVYENIKEQEDNWLTYYKIGQCQFLVGKIDKAFRSFDRAAAMENGRYMQGYPVAAALVVGCTYKAIEYAGLVDEGANYLNDLKEYSAKGFLVDEQVVDLIEQGDLDAAIQSLDETKAVDLFVKGLLYHLAGNHASAKDMLSKLQQVSPQESQLLAHLIK